MYIPDDHPSLAGHFPGYPLVPGVVILDKVINAFESGFSLQPEQFSFPQIKFLAPLLPGDEFEIRFSRLKENLVEFFVETEAKTYVKGRISYKL